MPLTYQDILQREPYGVSREEKRALLTEKLKELTAHHAAACPAYGRMLRTIGLTPHASTALSSCRFCRCAFLRRWS